MKIEAESWDLETPGIGVSLEADADSATAGVAFGRRYFYIQVFYR